MNNRENILQTSLELFSIKGYQAVSVRDICGALGLKESALYYHFKNKNALLDALYQSVDTLIQEMQEHFNSAFSSVDTISTKEMCQVAVSLLTNYLCNPNVLPLISMLTFERASNITAQDKYQQLVFHLPLKQIAAVFTQMSEKKMLIPCNIEVISYEYYAIIYTAFQQHCIGLHENKSDAIKAAAKTITAGIENFYNKYKAK